MPRGLVQGLVTDSRALYYSPSMSGRRPWVTSLLALVLGLVGFGLMFMADSTDDFSGWPLVISALQLPWLWIVDLRGRARDADPGNERLSLAARVTATLVLGLAGGVITAGPFYAIIDLCVATGVLGDDGSLLLLLASMALPVVALLWGLRAWLVSRSRTPRLAVRSMLAPLTFFSLPATGVCWVAHEISRDSNGFLVGLISGLALVGALVVLAWTTLPWLELYLSGRDTAAQPLSAIGSPSGGSRHYSRRMTDTRPLTAAEVVDANLAAYNARDIDGFMRWFTDDVEVIDQKTGAVAMRGLAEVRRAYAALFEASPALHSRIRQRTVVGGFVVDHEHVTGRAGGDVEILITYCVRDGRIHRVWFVREPLPDAV
jgi:hypothetical protein